MARKIDSRYLRNIVEKSDPVLKPSDDAYQAALMLLGGAHAGANIRRVARLTNQPLKPMFAWARNLRKNKVWVGERTADSGWGGKENGDLAFWLDVSIALGYLVRA